MLAHAARRIRHTRGVHDLKSFGRAGRALVDWAVIEHCGQGVPILSTVAPVIDAAVGNDTARPRKSGIPLHRVDALDHPLIGNARRKRPEQSKFHILAGVEWLRRTAGEESLPIGVGFTKLRHDSRPAPSPRLIYIPRQF